MSVKKVVYASCMCSEDFYGTLFSDIEYKPGQQVQKYHRVLARGLSDVLSDEKCSFELLSKVPLNRRNYNKFFFKGKCAVIFERKIRYLSYINVPVINNLLQCIESFFCMLLIKNVDLIVIDVLNVSMNIGLLSACILKKTKVLGIVTDLPDMLVANSDSKYVKTCLHIIRKCDGYVVLTEAMNKRINRDYKPSVVIEGQVDYNSKVILCKRKRNPYHCVYSGSINRIHGIEYLVKGFLEAKISNVQLDIYGDGDYAEELKEICKIHHNIKYYGTVLNAEVVIRQKEAMLLINPRPTKQEFVKYSFPSKNMEYMASGTPLLTTDLPGMPREYLPYVFIIKEETPEGISKCLADIFSMPEEYLNHFGEEAQSFVMNNKSGKTQAKKIYKIMNNICS